MWNSKKKCQENVVVEIPITLLPLTDTQSINTLISGCINSVYTTNKSNDFNNLISHNEEHIYVSKVYQNVSIFKRKEMDKKMKPSALGIHYHVNTCVLFKNKILRYNNCFQHNVTT